MFEVRLSAIGSPVFGDELIVALSSLLGWPTMTQFFGHGKYMVEFMTGSGFVCLSATQEHGVVTYLMDAVLSSEDDTKALKGVITKFAQ